MQDTLVIHITNITAGSTIYIKDFSYTTTGIKSLEQRQLNLFTFGNKIKVNGQIDEKLKLNVFNILGQLVIQTDLKNEIETTVATGVYILQVLDEHNNAIESKKVLLQN